MKKVVVRTGVKAYNSKASVSPAWQAQLDGKISIDEYNRIISKKVTLEEVLESHKKPTKKAPSSLEELYYDETISDAEYCAVINNKLSIGRLNKIRSYIKFYAKKINLELKGDELATSDNAECLYNDFMSYSMNNTGKLAKLCGVTANYIADYQQVAFN